MGCLCSSSHLFLLTIIFLSVLESVSVHPLTSSSSRSSFSPFLSLSPFILSPLLPHDHLFVRSCVCLCSSSHLFLLTIIFLSVLESVSVHPLTSSSSRSSFCPFLSLSLFILSPLPPHDHLLVRS